MLFFFFFFGHVCKMDLMVHTKVCGAIDDDALTSIQKKNKGEETKLY